MDKKKSSTSSNFQRSQSKVWWGNDNQLDYFDYKKKTLNHNDEKKLLNTKQKQEHHHHNSSSSPNSLKSHDSGFDDSNNNINNHQLLNTSQQSNHENGSSNDEDESDDNIINTPPTVIRKNKFYHNENGIEFGARSSRRRITYDNENNSPAAAAADEIIFNNKINSINYNNTDDDDDDDILCDNLEVDNNKIIEVQNSIKEDSQLENTSMMNSIKNNDEIRLHSTPIKNTYHNNNIGLVNSHYDDADDDLLDLSPTFNWHTCTYIEYTNPLLNGHPSSVQFWLDEIRSDFNHEVLSTLQTKSIAKEAARYFKLNSFMATKFIRHLQTIAIEIQLQFDKCDKYFSNRLSISSKDEKTPQMSNDLLKTLCNTISQFIIKLNTKYLFIMDEILKNDRELKKFQKNIQRIQQLNTELEQNNHNFGSRQHDHEMIYDDLILLKRLIRIVIRILFENLISVIVERIDEINTATNNNELLLKSNLSMLAMLSNMNYNGLASITDAFLAVNTIPVLSSTCLNSHDSQIKSMVLRIIATICSANEAIHQFVANCNGIDIIYEIIKHQKWLICHQKDGSSCNNKSIIDYSELREAVSVLTQITAPWHNNNNNKKYNCGDDPNGNETNPESSGTTLLLSLIVTKLKKYIDKFVEYLTMIINETTVVDNHHHHHHHHNHHQLLLLCTACLNNLSMIEKTTIYSIMSNNSILILKKVCDQKYKYNLSIFVYEQISNILLIMAENKRCLNHLSNPNIIQLLINIFESKFYEKYRLRAEISAHRKTIKNCLYIFNYLLNNDQPPVLATVSAGGVDLQMLTNYLLGGVFSSIEKQFHPPAAVVQHSSSSNVSNFEYDSLIINDNKNFTNGIINNLYKGGNTGNNGINERDGNEQYNNNNNNCINKKCNLKVLDNCQKNGKITETYL